MEDTDAIPTESTNESEDSRTQSPQADYVEFSNVKSLKLESDDHLVLEQKHEDLDISSDYSNISQEEVDQSGKNDGLVTSAKDELPEVNIETPSTSSSSVDVKTEIETSLEESKKLTESEKQLKNLCANMFAKLENYLKGEVANSVEDYALLEKMNMATSYKYQEMLKVATTVGQTMHDINHKFSELRPYLDQIDQIEQDVLALEKSAYKLDGYAKKLEERFRKLEKR